MADGADSILPSRGLIEGGHDFARSLGSSSLPPNLKVNQRQQEEEPLLLLLQVD